MATPKYLDFMSGDTSTPALALQERILSALAVLASGTNPDGTGFSLPVNMDDPLLSTVNIVGGSLQFTASAAQTLICTIPAGRIWVGYLSISVTVEIDAALATEGNCQCTILTNSAGAIPLTGVFLQCQTRAAANVALGLTGTQGSNSSGMPITLAAPVGNSVAINANSVIVGTNANASASAFGVLQ